MIGLGFESMTLEATAHTWLPIKHSSPWWENAFYHYQVILCEPNKLRDRKSHGAAWERNPHGSVSGTSNPNQAEKQPRNKLWWWGLPVFWSNSSFQGGVPEREANRICTDALTTCLQGPRGGQVTHGSRRPERAPRAGARWGPQLPCSLPWLSVPERLPGNLPSQGPGPAHALVPAAPAVPGFTQQTLAGGMRCRFWGSARSQPGGYCSYTCSARGCSPRSLAPWLQGAMWGHTRNQRSWQE